MLYSSAYERSQDPCLRTSRCPISDDQTRLERGGVTEIRHQSGIYSILFWHFWWISSYFDYPDFIWFQWTGTWIEWIEYAFDESGTDRLGAREGVLQRWSSFPYKTHEKTWKTYKMIRQRMMTCAVSWMLFSTLTSEHVKLRSPAPVLLMSTMPGICSISMQLYWHKRGLSY